MGRTGGGGKGSEGDVLNAGTDGTCAGFAPSQAGGFNTPVLTQGHPVPTPPSSLMMSGENLWLSQLGLEGAPGIKWVGARDAVQPLTVPRTAPTEDNLT